MERPNCVINRFYNEDGANTNVCVNSTHNTIQKISNDSCSMILNSSHDLTSGNLNKILKQEECVPKYESDKVGGYIFVDVGSDLVQSDYLLEEDNNICEASSETLFTDNKDIDNNLMKRVKIERHVGDSHSENESAQNLETIDFNVSDIYNTSNKAGLSTNACTENMCKNIDNYYKKPSIRTDYVTTTTSVTASGDFDKINMYVKEEGSVEDILVHQSTENVGPEIKKEVVVSDEEVLIQNESIIDIKSHAVNKIEDSLGIGMTNLWGLDDCSMSRTVNSNFQENYTECSDEVPDNCNIDDIVIHKPNKLKETERVQNKRKSHLKFQNKVQTLSETCNVLHIKPKIDSLDDSGADGLEECSNKLREEDVNIEAKSKNEECQYLRNRKSKHRTDRPYVCEVCCKDFKYLSILKAHKIIHTGDRPFSCSVCGKTFTRQSSLNEHKHIHTGDKPFGCSVCGKAFTHLSSFKRHKRIHIDDKPYVCSICGKEFKFLTNFMIHKRIHSGDKPFGCSICGNTFRHLRTLNKHKHTHTGDRPFGCSVCGKTFKQQSSLSVHKRIHTGDMPFICSVCGKTFAEKRCLNEHKCVHSGDRPFGCSVCGKTFIQKRSLRVHKRIHSDDKPFSCSVCGKTFKHQSSLSMHKHTHSGDMPFSCNVCGKTFIQEGSLSIHKCIHIGDRPFGCSVCGKTFTKKSHLNDHKRIHTGDRPFCCSVCGKTFTKKSHLNDHKRIHTGDRPFCCSVCGKTYTQKHCLNKHKCIHVAITQLNHLESHKS